MGSTQKYLLKQIGLLVIGDEILLGRRNDKHVSWARDYFSRINVDIGWIAILGDDPDLLERFFRLVRERGDDCFSFGGIGATPDDRTRQAVARAHDVPLTRHPEAVALLEKQFGEATYPNRILMAELPEGAGLIPNSHNNIPGFYYGRIHCLPGFPEMARPMVGWVVEHRYRLAPEHAEGFIAYIVKGAKESELVPLLSSCEDRFPDLKFSSLPRFSDGTSWQIELGIRGSSPQLDEGAEALAEGVRALGFTLETG
ncbi:MAG: competence/damage-inducible protein A [Desulfofustis sp.]|nr:competence/damage-inducible protein A [Desulfofustis sp.]MBT8347202.1 competence/damage-inducible protein A [Desulfofustis sp.]NNK14445.1 competence/damage-inducible protein A [Desulfofustis sp.]